LDGGFIGLALLFLMIISSGRRLVKTHPGNRCDLLRFAFLVVGIVYNLSESIYGRLAPLWFTTLLMIVVFPLRERTAATQIDVPVAARRPVRKVVSRR
jgi:hypothetical protein